MMPDRDQVVCAPRLSATCPGMRVGGPDRSDFGPARKADTVVEP
jgi:hypothetical protein